jgi:hypothetical protein
MTPDSAVPALMPALTYTALSEVAQAAPGQLHMRMAGLCYDTPSVEAMPFPINSRVPCRKTFIRKHFRLNPL